MTIEERIQSAVHGLKADVDTPSIFKGKKATYVIDMDLLITPLGEDDEFIYAEGSKEGYPSVTMKIRKVDDVIMIADLDDYAKKMGYNDAQEMFSDDRILDQALEIKEKHGVFMYRQ